MKKKILTVKSLFLCCILYLSVTGGCSDDTVESSDLTASAGSDMNKLVGTLVTLNGGGSYDSKANPFEFSWKFIAKPVGSHAELKNGQSELPSFTPDTQGKYKIELTISHSQKDMDTVTVSAFDVRNVEGEYDNLFPGPDVGIRKFVTAMGLLVATCEFTEIGGVMANKIARFNGSIWSEMGCGLDEEGSVYDMVEYKGQLYVTGEFKEIGCIEANNIARWDGATWHALKGGLTGGNRPFGLALAVYKDELYVGGLFKKAGDLVVSNIAKWNGTDWLAAGNVEDGAVSELHVFKEKLYGGGFFTKVNGTTIRYVGSYDGSSWSALGPLDPLELKHTGAVLHMAVYKDVLFMAGEFASNGSEVSELITWDGTQFSDFGKAFILHPGNKIIELSVINDILYIGGRFQDVVGSHTNNILQWNGSYWGTMEEGISGSVNSIIEYNGKTYIGGDFYEAGGAVADNISVWKEK
jgi:hypothetical protein